MSAEETRNENSMADEPREDLASDAEQVQAEAGQGDAVEPADSEVAALKAQVDNLKEQALRAQAEMQNVRRRAELDVEKAHKFALEKFVRELVPVVDSLEKAVESTGASEGEELLTTIREGVEMTLKMFVASLRKFNVEQVNPLGEPFDPQVHEAMSMVAAPDAEPNTVVAVMQKGYLLNDRLVRPAMVVVSKPDSAGNVNQQA
ncbi:nucleotide exchange factor GrpE [Mangrovitalea sediminis]|uniref:nucleotide exchange factor GrpE n=1 Tax=Mangrovitalea sediminis TaxID=1982043 RepID=UPI000BE50732|nr:nucleotide exchange factor GrpE [Mangrovitalea sediminis]